MNFESSNVTLKSESSLGIIENISDCNFFQYICIKVYTEQITLNKNCSFSVLDDSSVNGSNTKQNCPDQERELARKVIQQCDEYDDISFTSLSES